MPNDVFILGSHIQPQLANYIKQLMLDNQNKLLESILSVDFLATKFNGATLVTAKDQDYDIIREVYRSIGQGKFLS